MMPQRCFPIIGIAISIFFSTVSIVAAQQQKKNDAPKPLRWGMDETGGAPYIYDNRTKGFEVELAAYLAKELGRTSEPVSGDWKTLPELLKRGDLDIVLNGYEFSPTFRDQSSIPYLVFKLTLVVNKDDNDVKSWEDLRKRKPDGSKRKVVVLTGTVAQRYMEKYEEDVDVLSSDDVSSAYDLVARGQGMDASVQDRPAAVFYLNEDRGKHLKQVGDEPTTSPFPFYVVLTGENDKQLRTDIDAALRKGIKDGTLERIYRKYDLWNEDQERLLYWSEQPWPPGRENADTPDRLRAAPVDWDEVGRLLARAAGNTILLAFCSFPLAVLVGLFIAIVRLYGPIWLRFPASIYVEVVRGTPLLLQLFVIFYLIPRIAPELALEPFFAGILGLAINYSAYEAENFRAGLQAIPKGQMEAALALGMSPVAAVRRIVVPQAVRIVIPPITNDFIALFKDTSICSAILITELTRQYNVLYNNHREFIIVFAAMTAAIYLLMSYPLALLARFLERSLRRA